MRIKTPTTVEEARTFVEQHRDCERPAPGSQHLEDLITNFEFNTAPLRAVMFDDDLDKGFDVYARTAELFAKAADKLVEDANTTQAWDAAYDLLGHETACTILFGQEKKRT